MNRNLELNKPARLAAVLLALLISPATLRAQTAVSGTIINGTMGKPAAGLSVELLSPRGGMQAVAAATTDANGHYSLSGGSIDTSGFYLVQASQGGVDYHAAVQFDSSGQASVNLTVYDATQKPPALRISRARILVRAEGDKVHVQEMFAIENPSQPPRAYTNPSGTFLFRLPADIGKPQAAAVGLMNMTLPQEVNEGKAPGEYSIDGPLKPGTNVLMIAYDSDYANHQFTLDDRISYPIDHLELFALPATLAVRSDLFRPAGQDDQTGAEKLAADNLKTGAVIRATLSGEAAAASASDESAQQSPVKIVPNSVTKLGALLVACFLLVLLWALGIRASKEWPQWKERRAGSPARKQQQAKLETLLNSIADLDEVYASGKIPEKKYWKERLELKARVAGILKKGPKGETYAVRNTSR